MGHYKVGKDYGCGSIITNNPGVHCRMSSVEFQSFGAGAVHQLECPVSGLGDSMQIQQTEATVKLNGRKIVLFENVTKGPKAVILPGQRKSKPDRLKPVLLVCPPPKSDVFHKQSCLQRPIRMYL